MGGPSDWLAAQTSCLAMGGTLAKVESAAEQALVFGLIGEHLSIRLCVCVCVSLSHFFLWAS